ncbi:MAG: hypothetical protein ACW98D_01900 [Promethearchaeota archaeon]|jgi:hypothetical protein
MKKKIIILFIGITSLLFMSVLFYGSSTPPNGDGHSESFCHQNTGGYTLSANVSSTISVSSSSHIIINVSASGSDLFIQIYPGAEDNSLFTINPTTNRIQDGDIYDVDPSADMLVTFNITAPASKEFYYIFIIAGEFNNAQPALATLQIGVSVEGAAPPGIDFSNIFNHLRLYLGLPALLLVSLGTVLVLINENKFVKTHGILAGSSWILTVVNTATAIINIPISNWFGVYPLIVHVPHIILGALGLITGFFSMLFGIAAERKPALITGYITLASWWGAFFLGFFLSNNLISLL